MRERSLLLLFTFAVVSSTILFAGPRSDTPVAFRVTLHRVGNVKPTVSSGFVFDKEAVAEAVKKYPVKLPDPLPPGAGLGYSPGPTYALKQPVPGGSKIRLTIDVNGNNDLTDDPVLELSPTERIEDWTVVKIARPFGGPTPHTEILPYLVGYSQYKGRDGELQDSVGISPDYDFEGEFHLGDRDFNIRLYDGDSRGRFIKEKLVNVFVTLRPKKDETPAKGYRLFELIPLENGLYEVKNFAEDGSWIEFAKSPLPTTALGKPAPDLALTDATSAAFKLSDYRGKLLILDFWFAGCKPCIAKFPDIKATIEHYGGRPFAAIGVNIDKQAQLEQAKKIIADYKLSWRQVVEGKGEFIPSYQVYGRMAEMPMSFPIYVAIDELGTTRYSTNDFGKMKRFLEAHFTDPKGPANTLFVACPLSNRRMDIKTPPVLTADFTGKKVKALAASGTVKVPAGLPGDARLGSFPNGTVLIAYAGPTADTVHIIVDADHDLDLTKEQGYDIPVLAGPSPDESKMVKIEIRVPWASGGIAFATLPFYAGRSTGGAQPDVFARGAASRYEGTFFAGETEYCLDFADLNGDRMLTDEDTTVPGFLTLKVKKGDDWVAVHEGTSHIPIGSSMYRLKFVSDDGFLMELEKEK